MIAFILVGDLVYSGGVGYSLSQGPRSNSGHDAKSRLDRRRKQTAATILLGLGSIAILLVVLARAFPIGVRFLYSPSDFRGFKVPSQSMCPTICAGERIVADMEAYQAKGPQRGDVVLLRLPAEQALFIKRVIGVAGDTVEAGPNNEVLVDGKPLTLPRVCGSPVVTPNPDEEFRISPRRKCRRDTSSLSATIWPIATTVAFQSLAWSPRINCEASPFSSIGPLAALESAAERSDGRLEAHLAAGLRHLAVFVAGSVR